MKIHTFFIIVLFCGVTLFAQSQTTPNGYNIFYYGDSTIASEGFMKNGQPEGFWKSYYPTGKLKSEGNRRNFLLDSVWVFYSELGDTTELITYKYGKKNGFHFTYQIANEGLKNIPIKKELFVDNLQQGASYYFYPTGELQSMIYYENGKQNGIGYEYDKEKRIITILYYRFGRLTDRQYINRVDANGEKHGLWKEFYASGRTKTEINYRNGVLNGYYKIYDERGNVIKSERYENGVLVVATENETDKPEVKVVYHANGNVSTSGIYREGTPVGIHRQYSEAGVIENAEVFTEEGVKESEGIVDEEGKKQGDWKYFYENGQVRSQGAYTDNLRNGEWTYFFMDGKVEQKGKYRNDRPTGDWKWYYEDGSLLREESYINGRLNDLYTEYDRNGNVLVQGMYSEGEKFGEWKYQVGDHVEVGEYLNNMRNGVWKHYYLNGNLKFEGEFKMGAADGEHLFYYENGKLKERQHYRMDIPVKDWIKYDSFGVVINTLTYERGVVVKIDGKKVKQADEEEVME